MSRWHSHLLFKEKRSDANLHDSIGVFCFLPDLNSIEMPGGSYGAWMYVVEHLDFYKREAPMEP